MKTTKINQSAGATFQWKSFMKNVKKKNYLFILIKKQILVT